MPPPTTGGGSIIFPVCPLTTPISRDAMSHYLWRNANVTFHAMRLNSRTGREGPPVSSLNCDRPLHSGLKAPELVMDAGCMDNR